MKSCVAASRINPPKKPFLVNKNCSLGEPWVHLPDPFGRERRVDHLSRADNMRFGRWSTHFDHALPKWSLYPAASDSLANCLWSAVLLYAGACFYAVLQHVRRGKTDLAHVLAAYAIAWKIRIFRRAPFNRRRSVSQCTNKLWTFSYISVNNWKISQNDISKILTYHIQFIIYFR